MVLWTAVAVVWLVVLVLFVLFPSINPREDD